VALDELGSWQCGYVEFEDNGTATLEGLASGRFGFRASDPAVVIDPEFVTVGKNLPTRVEIRWRRIE
jgi:hypothetical protein